MTSVLEDREGHLWFGTQGSGVSRYDGTTFANFTTEDDLAHDSVSFILEDREDHLWFGTDGGVSRYNGAAFTNFTAKDGLAQNQVRSIIEDQKGHLWIGTFGGGVSRFDGLVLQTLTGNNGLVNDTAHQILQDRHGDIWITTEGGLTRYRPSHTPPTIHLTAVIADRGYGPVQELSLPSSQQFIIFEFQGQSFITRPDQLAYVYRLAEYDEEWRPTRERRVEYTDLPVGDYVFQIKAVDRDLTYSQEPAEVRVTIHPRME